jgi:nitrite reductase/ring-hydroxylating ferredoxin subunit
MKRVLFPLEEIQPGKMKAVEVNRRPLVVVRNFDGSVHVLWDRCPHYGAQLSKGLLAPMLKGDDPGQYEIDENSLVLRCPWHGYEFAVETGVCPADSQVKVRTFPAEVEDGMIVLNM